MSSTPKSILALDLGTRLGFALQRADKRIESGEQRLDLRTGEGDGMRYVKFRRFLIETKQSSPDLGEIIYEKVMGHGPFQVYSAHVYGGLLAVLQMFGEHHGIPYRGVNVSTIKKQFAGHGQASKTDVIRQCEVMGFTPSSTNEADAIALLHVATNQAPILTMSGATPKGPRRRRAPPEAPEGANPF